MTNKGFSFSLNTESEQITIEKIGYLDQVLRLLWKVKGKREGKGEALFAMHHLLTKEAVNFSLYMKDNYFIIMYMKRPGKIVYFSVFIKKSIHFLEERQRIDFYHRER